MLTEHAEPVEAATPYSSSFIMRSSPLTPRKVKWALLDKRNSELPLKVVSGI